MTIISTQYRANDVIINACLLCLDDMVIDVLKKEYQEQEGHTPASPNDSQELLLWLMQSPDIIDYGILLYASIAFCDIQRTIEQRYPDWLKHPVNKEKLQNLERAWVLKPRPQHPIEEMSDDDLSTLASATLAWVKIIHQIIFDK